MRGVDDAEAFSTNPIYWLLHESIYCDGPGSASAWAAERVQASLPAFDYTQRLDKGAEPILFTGEMVYKWMGEDYSALRCCAARSLQPTLTAAPAEGRSLAPQAARPGRGAAGKQG